MKVANKKYLCINTETFSPGLLAEEQIKSAFRGSRSSSSEMDPLEAGMPISTWALLVLFFWAVGPSAFSRSSSAFRAALLSAEAKQKKGDYVQEIILIFCCVEHNEKHHLLAISSSLSASAST